MTALSAASRARFAWCLWQQRGWYCCDVVQEEKVEQRCITYMRLIMNEGHKTTEREGKRSLLSIYCSVCALSNK